MTSDTKIEETTIEKMIGIYCGNKHDSADNLCDDCRELLTYAISRINKCPHHPKPKCSACTTHCFNTSHREKIKQVMKYAGPRMLVRHPILAVKHFRKTDTKK